MIRHDRVQVPALESRTDWGTSVGGATRSAREKASAGRARVFRSLS